MNFMYPRNKLVSVRVNEDLLNKFKAIVEIKDKYRYVKTNIGDLLEKALKNYIEENKNIK